MFRIKKKSLYKRERNPWKFAGPIKKVLLPIGVVYKKSKRKKWKIVDIRLYEEYEKSHLLNSIHISFSSIRKFIQSQNKGVKIVLVTRTERSFLYLVPWAKALGHKVYILKGGFDKNASSLFIKHNKKTKGSIF